MLLGQGSPGPYESCFWCFQTCYWFNFPVVVAGLLFPDVTSSVVSGFPHSAMLQVFPESAGESNHLMNE